MLSTTKAYTYLGHSITVMESVMQVFYVVDNNLKKGYWSMADAKRSISGQPVKFEAVDISDL